MSINRKPLDLPKKIVVYGYYGEAVYFDGNLVEYYQCGSRATDGWSYLCGLLGVRFEKRDVKWEDWPGQKEDSRAVYHPPKELAAVEAHFTRLEEERRRTRIKWLKEELTHLESEEAKSV